MSRETKPVCMFATALDCLNLGAQEFLQDRIHEQVGNRTLRVGHTFRRSTVATRLLACSRSATTMSNSASFATTSWSIPLPQFWAVG